MAAKEPGWAAVAAREKVASHVALQDRRRLHGSQQEKRRTYHHTGSLAAEEGAEELQGAHQ